MSATTPVDLDELAALEDQRDFLLRSLDDLDREHDAGDLDDDDYRTLRDDYTVRAAEVLRAIEQHREALDVARAPVRWPRVAAWVLGVVALAAVGGWAVAHFSGSTSTPAPAAAPVDRCIALTQQMLGGGADTSATPDPVSALRCYESVLRDDPQNVAALTYRGWTWALLARQLSGQVGTAEVDRFVKQSSASLEAALKVNPRFPDALVFSSINAYWQGDDRRARAYLARFDALRLPAGNQMSQLVDAMLRPQLSGTTTVPSSGATTTTAP